MPEALAALWSVLSAFLMLQRVEVLQKEVPNELSRRGKKNQRVCIQAHTVVSIESDYQCVTTGKLHGRIESSRGSHRSPHFFSHCQLNKIKILFNLREENSTYGWKNEI